MKQLRLVLFALLFFLFSVGSSQAMIIGHLCDVYLCHYLIVRVDDYYTGNAIAGASVTVKRYYTGYVEGTQTTNATGDTDWMFDVDKFIITTSKAGYTTLNETFDMQNYSMAHIVYLQLSAGAGLTTLYITPQNINATGTFKISISSIDTWTPLTFSVYGFYTGETVPSYIALLPPMMNQTYQYTVNSAVEGLRTGYYTFYVNTTDVLGSTYESNTAVLNIQSGEIVPPVNLTTNWQEPDPAVCSVTDMREAGMGWILPFCTPFFWAICIMLSAATIVGYATHRAGAGGNVGGVAFLTTILSFSLMYLLYGIFPSWLGILFVLGEGMGLAYMLSRVFSGGGGG